MENSKRTVVLNELRRIVWIITVFNQENFPITDRKTILQNISIALIYSACFTMLGLILVTSVWYCFDCNFAIKESSLAIPIGISAAQMMGIYISLTLNNRKITQFVDNLQETIENREFPFRVRFLEKLEKAKLSYLNDFPYFTIFCRPIQLQQTWRPTYSHH